MAAIFKNILIPVDFSINTEVAVKKSLEIIEPKDSAIILLHVEKYFLLPGTVSIRERFFRNLPNRYYHNKNLEKLFGLKNLIKENFPGISVMPETEKASGIEKAIIEKANQMKPDIIVIGKNSHHARLPFLNTVSPNRIAKKTGFPVLIVKPGSIHNKTRSVVVPVGSFVPERKMELILALRKKFRISIHLVTVMANKQDKTDFSPFALLNTYKFLRDVAQCPLGHEVLHGDNIAKSTLKYAQQIKADMLLVDPEKETKLMSFMSKHISDELRPDSGLQILTVQH